MSNTDETDTTRTCRCHDPEVEELRDLIAAGFDQFEASRLLWGSGARVSTDLAVELAGRRARRLVRTALAQRLPWLRLPTPTDLEVS